ncbi:lipopolysaccharide biosynthesis protein [Halomonas nitroreducens]|uniref:Lipopolysaccharide biosynthesis protein n=1 Tax=Halomonas nitroreducens TaxID=447425 RepID=A0A3S0K184_9GAMM|nr:lipopolysaccharide biosynthesis protein [Halomonas nitroreducens]RTR00146.1 lipopolysaccharide biosynthesis protein [Halomonas nitroreducens]
MSDQYSGKGRLSTSKEDEISFVDLAKILILRWKIMAVVFSLFMVMALGYIAMMPRQYEYVTIYHLAEQAALSSDHGGSVALESPKSVESKLKNLYFAPATRGLLESTNLESLPFRIHFSNPADTKLLVINSEAAEQFADHVETLHQDLIERVMENQQELIEQRRAVLESQLESTERGLEAVKEANSEYTSQLMASYSSRILELQAQLGQLKEGMVEKVAARGLNPVGMSRSLLLALSIAFGLLFAVLSAFMMQFVLAVKKSLAEG